MRIGLQFRGRVAALLLGAAVLCGCQSPWPAAAPRAESAQASAEVRRTLAPTGTLRIAVYSGSPTSLVRQPGSDEVRGVSVDVGREMAARFGVPARIVELERVEQVVEALRTAQADVTVTNATAARAALVDLSEPLVALELGYLVLPGSPVASLADVDRAGIRVGVSAGQGSSSQATLGRAYRQASLMPAPSLAAAADMLKERRIDAFATNKGILFQLADGLPGARVLDGRWGTESLAIAVPKGREPAGHWLEGFGASVREQGLVRRAAERAGLRGLADAAAR